MGDLSEISIAEGIARRAHSGQTEESTGDDYILHVQRVVNLVDGCNSKIVAWLHDVIEDSDIDELDLLEAGITARNVIAVRLLTRSEAETYAEYIDRIFESGNQTAIEVKIADLRDHLRPNCPERLRPRYEKAWERMGAGL